MVCPSFPECVFTRTWGNLIKNSSYFWFKVVYFLADCSYFRHFDFQLLKVGPSHSNLDGKDSVWFSESLLRLRQTFSPRAPVHLKNEQYVNGTTFNKCLQKYFVKTHFLEKQGMLFVYRKWRCFKFSFAICFCSVKVRFVWSFRFCFVCFFFVCFIKFFGAAINDSEISVSKWPYLY